MYIYKNGEPLKCCATCKHSCSKRVKLKEYGMENYPVYRFFCDINKHCTYFGKSNTDWEPREERQTEKSYFTNTYFYDII